mmetsp:Transcript_13684/g.32238  ORF Transcript_13684/g.32238 Transcript_13684/m.32238 type:complete len:332 (+) Transcript_13684:1972-2967(+)
MHSARVSTVPAARSAVSVALADSTAGSGDGGDGANAPRPRPETRARRAFFRSTRPACRASYRGSTRQALANDVEAASRFAGRACSEAGGRVMRGSTTRGRAAATSPATSSGADLTAAARQFTEARYSLSAILAYSSASTPAGALGGGYDRTPPWPQIRTRWPRSATAAALSFSPPSSAPPMASAAMGRSSARQRTYPTARRDCVLHCSSCWQPSTATAALDSVPSPSRPRHPAAARLTSARSATALATRPRRSPRFAIVPRGPGPLTTTRRFRHARRQYRSVLTARTLGTWFGGIGREVALPPVTAAGPGVALSPDATAARSSSRPGHRRG